MIIKLLNSYIMMLTFGDRVLMLTVFDQLRYRSLLDFATHHRNLLLFISWRGSLIDFIYQLISNVGIRCRFIYARILRHACQVLSSLVCGFGRLQYSLSCNDTREIWLELLDLYRLHWNAVTFRFFLWSLHFRMGQRVHRRLSWFFTRWPFCVLVFTPRGIRLRLNLMIRLQVRTIVLKKPMLLRRPQFISPHLRVHMIANNRLDDQIWLAFYICVVFLFLDGFFIIRSCFRLVTWLSLPFHRRIV